MPTVKKILEYCYAYVKNTHTYNEKVEGECIYKSIMRELITNIEKDPQMVKKSIEGAVKSYNQAFLRSYMIGSDIPLPPNNLGQLIKFLQSISCEEIINDYQVNKVSLKLFPQKLENKSHSDGRDLTVAVLGAGKNFRY